MLRKAIQTSSRQTRQRLLVMTTTLAALATAGTAVAQPFDSGSSGEDGAFAPSESTDFDPSVIHVDDDLDGPLIDEDGDNVFHFTNITIPSGVTVKLSSKWTNGPVYWLATGAVNIEGIVDLNGEDGHPRTITTSERRPSLPGPGGYPGGIGGSQHAQSKGAPQPGAGPGGGKGGSSTINCNGYYCGLGAFLPESNKFLVPLIGGSGGGGGIDGNFEWWGAGGGAGGGALLISSSASINLKGQIIANGGRGGVGQYPSLTSCNFWNQYFGGSGGGGSVRLVAPVVDGTASGTISVNGNTPIIQPPGCVYGPSQSLATGAAGKVRIEAFQHPWKFSIPVGSWSTGSPLNSFAPTTPPPSIRVVRIDGQDIREGWDGGFDPADFTIDTRDAVEIVIEAHYVPVGTVPKLYLFSLEENDQVITAPVLQGTLENSTSTILVSQNVKFPSGFSRGYVHAKWTAAP